MAETTSKAAPKKTAGKATAKPAEVKAKSSKAPAAVKPASPSKTAALKPSPAKTPSKKPAPKKAATATANVVVTEEQRYRMIAEAAYYRAESNQFKSDPIRDWIDAEKDISILLSGTR